MPINKEELLFTVDENNNSVDPRPRGVVHREGLWHRTAHVWIINSKGEILCQKRSMKKDSKPGLWEARFGGHLAPRADYLETAIVEAEEELGLKINRGDLKSLMVYKSEPDKEFQGEYLLKWDGELSDLIREEEEVDELRWMKIKEVQKFFQQRDSNWVFSGCEEEILNRL